MRGKANKRVGTPGEEIIMVEEDQSVFPVRTPDKDGFLGPLSDLLEEEITLPGESRRGSAVGDGRKNWAYLPSPSETSSTASDDLSNSSGERPRTWEQRVEKALGEGVAACAAAAREAEDELVASAVATLEGKKSPAEMAREAEEEERKKRAISAKSHIFRKGKVDAARPADAKSTTSRPWSAHESRLQADPIFAMRRRHWEGLISGKKRLHRGQLLPGSTSEEELKEQLSHMGRTGAKAGSSSQQVPRACWSECTSPRKQVRIQDPPITHSHSPPQLPSSSSDQEQDGQQQQMVAAIKEELQKFGRPKSGHEAITVISDPKLVNEEEQKSQKD